MHGGVFVGREQGSVVSTIVDLMSECEETWNYGPSASVIRDSALYSSVSTRAAILFGSLSRSLIYNLELLTKMVLQFVPGLHTQLALMDHQYELLSRSINARSLSSIHTPGSAPPNCTPCPGSSFLFPVTAALVTFISMVGPSS
jgi:hypothetical protein